MKLKSQLILVLSLLAACQQSTAPLPQTYPANMTSPCDNLAPFSGNNMGDLVQYTVYLGQSYNACALKHKALGDLLNAKL